MTFHLPCVSTAYVPGGQVFDREHSARGAAIGSRRGRNGCRCARSANSASRRAGHRILRANALVLHGVVRHIQQELVRSQRHEPQSTQKREKSVTHRAAEHVRDWLERTAEGLCS